MKDFQIIKSSQEQTTILRESNDYLVKSIRLCLVKKGLNPNQIVVAEWFPDDVNYEYGIIINSEKEVFQFGYDYYGKKENEGEFSEWHNITENWKDTPLSKSVDVILKNYAKIT